MTVFDDFNQQTDSASNPNLELFEIIRSSNCFPYPLHMAAIDQKANTSFTSKIIIVSSNMERPKTQSLNFPDAMERRFDICIRVNRKDTELSLQGKFDPNSYELVQYDMKTGHDLGSIGYKELVLLSCQQYFKRRSFVNTVENYIESVLSDTPENVVQQGGIDNATTTTAHDSFAAIRENKQNWTYETTSRRSWFSLSMFSPMNKTKQDLSLRRQPNITEIFVDSIIKPTLATYNRCKEYMWPPSDPWTLLSQSTDSIRKQYDVLTSWWINFRQEHPYLINMLTIISLITTGLVFIKVFTMFNSKRKSKLLTEDEAFGKPRNCSSCKPKHIRNANAESYSVTKPLIPKVESYTPVKITQPKFESLELEDERPKQQGVKDINASEVLSKVIRRSLYKMYESSMGTALGHVFFIRGRLCLMPRHYMDGLRKALNNDDQATVTFQSAVLNEAFEYSIKDLIKGLRTYKSPTEDHGPVVTKDYMACEIPSATIHPDTLGLFCTRNSLSQVQGTEVVLPVVMRNNIRDSEKPIVILRYRKAKSAITRVPSLDVGDEKRAFVRTIRDAWRYDADTEPAECGAPVIVRNNQVSPGKICGFHIAGVQGTGEGFAVPFYREDIEEILSMFPQSLNLYQKQQLILGPVKEQGAQIPEKAEFIRLGTTHLAVAQPVKTKIRPSACYGCIQEPKTQPCALRPRNVNGQEFDPRKYRLERLGNIPQAIGRDVVNNAKRALVDEIASVLSKRQWQSDNIKSVYSFEEAVKGIDGELFINSIKRTTSPGYPFIHEQGFKTRKEIFGEKEEYDMETPSAKKLAGRVLNIIEEAKSGIVGEHIFMDTLKDERKPHHKCHKTRLFSAGPIDYLIACKQYFNGIVALLQHNRNACHISVGSNPYSEDWNQIVTELHRKSSNIVAGDFEGFDASQNQQLLTAAGEVLIELSTMFCNSTSEDQKVMRVLMCSLTSSIHITGNEIYQWTHSLPSGHYLTAIINSIFVNLAFSCIWQIAFGDISYLMARKFWDECGIVAYGDDHLVSIPEDRLSVFSQLTMPNLFRLIGLSYTMEDKDAVATCEARSIMEVSYLKRTFELNSVGRWIAPLSLDTILESPMWVHVTPDVEAQTVETLDWAIRELSLHSENVWNTWIPVLVREQRRLGFYTRFTDWFETRIYTLNQEVREF